MQVTAGTGLSRQEMRDILRRHEGAIGEIAAGLQVRIQSVSGWINDERRTSRRIEQAVREKVLGLLEMEAAA